MYDNVLTNQLLREEWRVLEQEKDTSLGTSCATELISY